jgi:predicted ATP-dependent Lon-type protease
MGAFPGRHGSDFELVHHRAPVKHAERHRGRSTRRHAYARAQHAGAREERCADGPRSGSLRTSGLGSNASAREAIKVGFDYFNANANRVSASIKAGDHDYHLHVVELHNSGAATAVTWATFVVLCSGALSKPLRQQMVVLGSMSLSGSIVPVENLAETSQVAFAADAVFKALGVT